MNGHTISSAFSSGAWLLASLTLGLAGPAAAVPLPDAGARAEASASVPGDDAGTLVDTDATFATITNTVSSSDYARGRAEAMLGGSLRSSSETSAASGQAVPSQAGATASFVTQLATTGTDPGGAIDIDLALSVSGSLTYLNNNSGAGADDIRSSVIVRLILHDIANGALSVFDGSAVLSTVTNGTPPALTRFGDWSDSSRDGDFSSSSCSAFSCQVDVTANLTFENLLLVGFGDVFAAEFQLETTAFGFAGFEVESGSNFFDTGSIVVSTDTPGIEFSPVPEPDTASLLAFGLLALVVGRRCRRLGRR